MYVATPDNDNYLGPASIEELVHQIAPSVGPSGPNTEYVLELAASLRDMGAEDPHVYDLAAALEAHLSAR